MNQTPSKYLKRAHGNVYEAEAVQFLERNGYQILARNVNYPCGEIDIIAETHDPRGLTLVFIEVRKRDPESWIRAEETITFPKQRTLKNAMTVYLTRYRGRAQQIRFDLLAFDGTQMKHFKDFIRY